MLQITDCHNAWCKQNWTSLVSGSGKISTSVDHMTKNQSRHTEAQIVHCCIRKQQKTRRLMQEACWIVGWNRKILELMVLQRDVFNDSWYFLVISLSPWEIHFSGKCRFYDEFNFNNFQGCDHMIMTYKSLSAILIKDMQVVRNLHIKITTDCLKIFSFELL